MKTEEKILLNQYVQDVVTADEVLERFNQLNLEEKRYYLIIFIEYFIMQSKPVDNDVDKAIINSNLKPTFTPCVLLKKGGVATYNLFKIANLPEYELGKALRLLLAVFRIAYLRRYEVEKGTVDSNKWWYSDLSDPKNVEYVLTHY